jgi:hypothetical protein
MRLIATPTPGTKMMYLIKRRANVAREELVAHWFANHMPDVIENQQQAAAADRRAARRYIATLFDADAEKTHLWDGVAQLWFDEPLPMPKTAIGTRPRDSFQERAEPYVPWATREYVAMEGDLPVVPLTLNPPFPCTRSGFHKITFLVTAEPGIDYGELFEHWLNIHVPNVLNTMEKVGGTRYVVSHSLSPETEPYAGMAELYYPDSASWDSFLAAMPADGIQNFIERLDILSAQTEMIGIP